MMSGRDNLVSEPPTPLSACAQEAMATTETHDARVQQMLQQILARMDAQGHKLDDMVSSLAATTSRLLGAAADSTPSSPSTTALLDVAITSSAPSIGAPRVCADTGIITAHQLFGEMPPRADVDHAVAEATPCTDFTLATVTPTKCSKSGPDPNVDDAKVTTMPQLSRGMSTTIQAQAEPEKTSSPKSLATGELGTVMPTKCSTSGLDSNTCNTEVSLLQSQPFFMKNDGGTRLLPPWPPDQAMGVKSLVVEMGMSPESFTHSVLLLHQPWPPPVQVEIVRERAKLRPIPWSAFLQCQDGEQRKQQWPPSVPVEIMSQVVELRPTPWSMFICCRTKKQLKHRGDSGTSNSWDWGFVMDCKEQQIVQDEQLIGIDDKLVKKGLLKFSSAKLYSILVCKFNPLVQFSGVDLSCSGMLMNPKQSVDQVSSSHLRFSRCKFSVLCEMCVECSKGTLRFLSFEQRRNPALRGQPTAVVQVPVSRDKADLNICRNVGSEVVAILATKGKCECASIDEVILDLTDAAKEMLLESPPESPELIFEEATKSNILGLPSDVSDREKNVRAWLCGADADYQDKLLSCGAIMVMHLRIKVLEETQFTCSAGIAHNKMLAKLVSGMHKPAQQTVVPSSSIQDFLASLPVKQMKQLGACGVCHSDLHVLKGELPFSSPCVVGHEITGEVVDHGTHTPAEIINRFPVGSHVVGAFIMPCGNCFYCVKGQEDLCESFFAYNRAKGTLYDGETRLFLRSNGKPVYMYSMGGLAEYCVVPANALAVLPNSLPYTESAILGCAVFTAYGALRHAAEMRAGDSVAVIGVGGVGSSCLQIARAFGASELIAVDVLDEKLQNAKTLGATHTVNAAKEDAVERIKEITDGRGVDVAVEALGKALTFSQCTKSVRDGGKAVMIGLAAANVVGEVDITRLVRRQVKIIGSYGARARQDLPQIVKLAESGAFNLQNAVSRKCKFEEANNAYEDLDRGKIVGRAVVEIM